MNTLLSIRVQKLFAIAVFLKVVSAFLGWRFQMQWSLGLVMPLLVMIGYIVLGLKRQDRDVTDEKFADSCYYLGFIFTITSIVFSLFDLPNIGERIQDIAVRFGAAMVSTVLGLAVRVYLVSFRPDSSDALKNSEDAVLEAAHRFREQLVMAYEKLGDFQSQVTAATQTSVESVKLQVEKLTKDHSDRMERVFVELNERNQQAVTQALLEVSAASSRMAQSVDDYADSMKTNLQSLGDKVEWFGEAMAQRLKTTTFPDDYFVARLAAPLEQLNAASSLVSAQVQSAANSTSEAATVLTAAIRKLRTKAEQAEESLDTVVRLTTAQHSLFDTSAAQLEQLQKLGGILSDVQQALQASMAASSDKATENENLWAGVTAALSTADTSQRIVVNALGEASSGLGHHVQSAEAAIKELAQELRGTSAMTKQLAARIETDAITKSQLAAAVEELKAQRESICAVLQNLDRKVPDNTPGDSYTSAQLRGLTERLDTLMSKLVVGAAPVANAVFAIPSIQPGTPSPHFEALKSELLSPLTLPIPDAISRLSEIAQSVSQVQASPRNTPGTGHPGETSGGTPQG